MFELPAVFKYVYVSLQMAACYVDVLPPSGDSFETLFCSLDTHK